MGWRDGVFETHDLGLAAWINMQWPNGIGLELLKAERPSNARGRRGRFVFAFLDPARRGVPLQVSFLKSCCARHDGEVRRLRGMVE